MARTAAAAGPQGTVTAGRSWLNTLASMTEPFAVEERLRAAPPPEVLPVWVLDTSKHGTRGLLHSSALPAGTVPLGSEVTRCGWHFGNVPSVSVTRDQPSAGDYRRVGKGCAHSLRRRLRGDLVADVVRADPPLP